MRINFAHWEQKSFLKLFQRVNPFISYAQILANLNTNLDRKNEPLNGQQMANIAPRGRNYGKSGSNSGPVMNETDKLNFKDKIFAYV